MRLRIPSTVNHAYDIFLQNHALLRDATASGNLRVLLSLFGPAYRGLIQQRGKGEGNSLIELNSAAHFDWHYKREHPEMRRLTEFAKTSQWNASTDLDWTQNIEID